MAACGRALSRHEATPTKAGAQAYICKPAQPLLQHVPRSCCTSATAPAPAPPLPTPAPVPGAAWPRAWPTTAPDRQTASPLAFGQKVDNAVFDDFDHAVRRDIGFLTQGTHVQLNDQGAAHDHLLHCVLRVERRFLGELRPQFAGRLVGCRRHHHLQLCARLPRSPFLLARPLPGTRRRWPLWLSGRMVRLILPSRVGTATLVPSAASQRQRHGDDQVMAFNIEQWVRCHANGQEQVAIGPPPLPGAPWPLRRIRSPSVTPAGIFTFRVLV